MPSSYAAKINLTTAVIVCMNAMIGSGIFTAPAAIAANVGPAGILAYLFVVVAVWFMALSLARLSTLFPQEGSFYTYTSQWMGHSGALITCFMYIGGMLLAMGLLVHTASFYLQMFFPFTSLHTLGVSTIILLVVFNMFGLVLSQLGQHILIAFTLFPLLAITLLCFTHSHASYLTPFAPYGLTNVFRATHIVIFGFFGFEAACSLFSVMSNPGRNISRALTISIILVGCIYTLFITSIILAIPLHYFTNPAIPLSYTLSQVLPSHPWLITCIHISILSAVLGTLHSMIWSVSTLLVSLMKKIYCIQPIYKYIPIYHRQKCAVFAAGLAIFTSFSTISNLDLFFSLTAIGIVSAYLLSMVTLLIIPAEWSSGRNLITLSGIATGLTIFYYAAQELVLEVIKIIQ